ncbi:PEP-CTERM system TPR-repeat protein PrsT [Aestuariibacter halophilus]|uniref:PEP-CTERM system TPR-repeat protein PrsT n=1 Tax=Fluctibacter halophilus TaxID=226011 RepID=A0ABS8G2T0_9ALTE|nr:XrtA/PEP-CTERM system TPR-repeat protein PrsT [Aestuariibacter halophilus]MCC2614887.1 PEP-CTERM system TPR-repeat protein PrsT [Aestuariibacter halophilus]
MKTFRKHALASSLVVLLGTGCSQQSSDELVAKAQSHMAQQNHAAAIIELKNAVMQSPDDPTVRALLGEAYVEDGQLLAAEKELNKALDNGASAERVLPKLAFALYHSEQLEGFERLAGMLDGVSPQTVNIVNLYRLLAALRLPDNGGESPTTLLQQLQGTEATLGNAYVLLNNNANAEAVAALSQLPAGEYVPEQAFLRGVAAFRQGDYDSAVTAFEQVKTVVPHPNSTNFHLIEALMQAGQWDKAISRVDALFAMNKNSPMTNFYKARLAYREDNYEPAMQFAEQAIQNGVDTVQARIIAGVSAHRLAANEQALKHLVNVTNREGFNNGAVERLLAQVQLRLGYTEEAAATLRNINERQLADASMYAEAGMQLAASGDLDEARGFMNQATSLDDDNLDFKVQRALMNAGINEQAVIDELRDVVAQDPDKRVAWIQLAKAHLRSNDQAAAVEVAKQWQQHAPVQGRVLEGFVYLEGQDYVNAASVLESVLAENPQQMDAQLYLVDAYQRGQQPEKAYALAKQVLTEQPDNMKGILALVVLADTLDQRKDMQDFLNGLTGKASELSLPTVGLALDARYHDDPERAIALLEPKQGGLNTLGKMTLGDAYFQAGQYRQAMQFYQGWVEQEPASQMANLRLIGMNELMGDNAQALTLTEAAQRHLPNVTVFKLLEINYRTKLGEIARAEELLKAAKSLPMSDRERLSLSLYEGQVAVVKKRYAHALTLLSDYHRRSPSFLSAILIAKSQVGVGEVEKARATLEAQMGKVSTATPAMLHVVAEFYLQNGYYQDAFDSYERLAEKDQNDFFALNNLAYVAMQLEQWDKAEAAATKALALAPENPYVLDTAGTIAFERGNIDQAFTHLYKANERLPQASDIAVHLAKVYTQLGNAQKAREVLQRVKSPSDAVREMLQSLPR